MALLPRVLGREDPQPVHPGGLAAWSSWSGALRLASRPLHAELVGKEAAGSDLKPWAVHPGACLTKERGGLLRPGLGGSGGTEESPHYSYAFDIRLLAVPYSHSGLVVARVISRSLKYLYLFTVFSEYASVNSTICSVKSLQ